MANHPNRSTRLYLPERIAGNPALYGLTQRRPLDRAARVQQADIDAACRYLDQVHDAVFPLWTEWRHRMLAVSIAEREKVESGYARVREAIQRLLDAYDGNRRALAVAAKAIGDHAEGRHYPGYVAGISAAEPGSIGVTIKHLASQMDESARLQPFATPGQTEWAQSPG